MDSFNLISLNMKMATDEDNHLPAYDHTKLSAINTCPTYGILRYSMHKVMPNSKRAMALEAGSTSHEGFAAVRIFQYSNTQAKSSVQRDNVQLHGLRLFGETRFTRMQDVLSDGATDRTNAINFAIEAIESTNFYDDIEDNRRTMSNITEAIISYVDAYDMLRYPIWIRDETDPETDIGIEIPFNIVVSIECEAHKKLYSLQVRFTGKLDGLHWDKDKLLMYEEKTGARLDDNWLSQWILSHQITGYCLAASTFTELPCDNAMIGGMRIPIGRVPAEGIRKEKVPRNALMYEKWANWFVTTIEMEQEYRDNVVQAPMYTHSCNRYFSTCTFLPFCAALDNKEKEEIIQEMEHDKWDVLDE
jgi:hypothetical protein